MPRDSREIDRINRVRRAYEIWVADRPRNGGSLLAFHGFLHEHFRDWLPTHAADPYQGLKSDLRGLFGDPPPTIADPPVFQRYHASLWGAGQLGKPGLVPHSYQKARDEWEAACLALSEFRQQDIDFGRDSVIHVMVSTGDADEDEQGDGTGNTTGFSVSELADWTRRAKNDIFAKANGLEWLQEMP